MTAVANSYIVLDEQGRAWIDGANTKVIEIAMDVYAHGWSPEEIHFQHSHLTLAQIHAALSYYYAHKPEFDKEIKRGAQEVERMRREQGESPFEKRINDLELIGLAGAPEEFSNRVTFLPLRGKSS